MRNYKFYLSALLVLTSVVFSSCDGDDDEPKGEFERGVFVVNEGNFLDADGTVSHISVTGEVTNDLFGSINGGRALGDVVQSMTIDGDVGYIVVNNSNKLEVVNANTFAASYTVNGLSLPRYFTTFNGKGYVTEWVSFSDPGRVSVINLKTHEIEGSVTTDFGAENIIAQNGKLYVSNNFTTTVSVIDPGTREVVKNIEVGNSPGGFVSENQGLVWVICGGGYDDSFNPLNDGKLIQVNTTTDEVVKTIELNMNVTAKVAIDKEHSTLFFYKGKSVYALSTAATSVSAGDILLTENSATGIYGIGVDPGNDILYIADVKAFAGSGTVYTYSTSGEPIQSYTVGRGPNGFVFR